MVSSFDHCRIISVIMKRKKKLLKSKQIGKLQYSNTPQWKLFPVSQLLGFPGGSVAKNPPAVEETQVQSLGQKDPLEEEAATHASILAWKIPWTEKPGGLQLMRLQRLNVCTHAHTHTQTCWKWKWRPLSCVQLFVTPCPWTCPYSPWNSPGQNTGVGSLSLLQGIFLTQRSNPGLLHSRQILYQLSHKASPRILECVAFPFSRGSSWPRNQTRVSCIAGRFFTNWAIVNYLLYIIFKSIT